ncbi:hypothetical protein [Streptomyces sp. NPDC006879]|uniref:hypothetical protein n=1 Tax=Streptomyces sp. NPDC006879 TaxID=3364767 RepID=UPI0036CF673A
MHELTITPSRRQATGGLLWVSLLQIFIVDVVVFIHATTVRPTDEIISALGETQCGRLGAFHVCSPWHESADIAWVIGGLSLAVGALCNLAVFTPGFLRNLAFGALTISGLALVSTGLNPYNVRPSPHLFSAGTCFFMGSAGVVLLGLLFLQANRPHWGWAGVSCGAIGITGTTLTALKPIPDLQGLFERVGAWPSVVWVMATGAFIVRAVYRHAVAR